MLADGVEAASRAVKPADEKKLDALIGQLIEIPLEDGQLDECPLTIPEINAVRESFFKTLKGLYHQRIEYPEEKDGANGDDTEVDGAEVGGAKGSGSDLKNESESESIVKNDAESSKGSNAS